MKNGNIIVVNCVPKVFDLRSVGGKNNQTVWGDGYTIYDTNGNKVSSWDVFGELDPRNDPNILGIGINEANYPVVYDWVHANTINFDSDGNLLMCFKQLNQVWKIDSKTGRVIFRLGQNGNVAMDSTFTTQGVHSVNRDLNGNYLFFDNGLFRRQSRALSFTVDTISKTSTLTREIVLPKKYFSRSQGSVYMIDKDHYLFGLAIGQAIIITDTKGEILWVCSTSHVFYRAYPIGKIQL
jgi:arylsulfate sulfotransferase